MHDLAGLQLDGNGDGVSGGDYVREFTVAAPSDPGDFDADGMIDDTDIDLLYGEANAGTNDLSFDLTGDGAVDADDLTELVTVVLDTTFGDVNLDRSVDRRDAAAMIRNLGRLESPSWSSGDMDGDGRIGLRDLTTIQSHLGFSGTAPSAPVASVTAVATSSAMSKSLSDDLSPTDDADPMSRRLDDAVQSLRVTGSKTRRPTHRKISDVANMQGMQLTQHTVDAVLASWPKRAIRRRASRSPRFNRAPELDDSNWRQSG